MTSTTITGNLVSDPEVSQTRTGKTVTKFRLAVSEGKDKPSSFYNVTVWDEMGEHVAQSLRSGMRAIVEGRLVLREYEDRNGNKRVSPDVTADSVGPDLRFATATVTRANGQGTRPAPAGGAGMAAMGTSVPNDVSGAPSGSQDAWAGDYTGTDSPF